MIDIKFLRENPDAVRENIKKKFQDEKLPLVDEVIENDKKAREAQKEADEIRAQKKQISKQIGILMKQGKKDEAMALKDQVNDNSRLEELDRIQKEASEIVHKDMMVIPQIIDPSVPIGKDDSENVELQRFGEPKVPDYE
ncbi:MAG TPA: serine--tRNA ligase, partial [Lachnospiraceae bacterium]|nr:serine--tRNA ligase [Lachnospiraceae bacterium]